MKSRDTALKFSQPELVQGVTVKGAQKHLKVARETVRSMCADGTFPGATNDGRGHWRIPTEDILRVAETRGDRARPVNPDLGPNYAQAVVMHDKAMRLMEEAAAKRSADFRAATAIEAEARKKRDHARTTFTSQTLDYRDAARILGVESTAFRAMVRHGEITPHVVPEELTGEFNGIDARYRREDVEKLGEKIVAAAAKLAGSVNANPTASMIERAGHRMIDAFFGGKKDEPEDKK